VCRGMSSCPWGTCGGGLKRGLVGFLWGTPKASGGSRSRAFRDLGLRSVGCRSKAAVSMCVTSMQPTTRIPAARRVRNKERPDR
jgi:hypothetical protein